MHFHRSAIVFRCHFTAVARYLVMHVSCCNCGCSGGARFLRSNLFATFPPVCLPPKFIALAQVGWVQRKPAAHAQVHWTASSEHRQRLGPDHHRWGRRPRIVPDEPFHGLEEGPGVLPVVVGAGDGGPRQGWAAGEGRFFKSSIQAIFPPLSAIFRAPI